MFDAWAMANVARFRAVLEDGERVVGEWLAQAHGTRYALPHEPFVAFDLMVEHRRRLADIARVRLADLGFVTPRILSAGPPLSIGDMLAALEPSGHGALDPVEGAVWRVERLGEVIFLAKFLSVNKVDGCYLPEISGCEAVWNWRPSPVLYEIQAVRRP